MTSATASDLSDLLNQAARNAVVKARSQSARSITVSQYKAAAMARSQSYQGGRVPLSLDYRLELPRGPVHDALHSLLAAALRGHTKEDRVQLPLMTGPAPGSGFPLTELVHRLTELSVLLGPTPAAEAFLTSLSDPRCPFVEYYLLSGISALETTQIYEGVALTRLPYSSSELPHWLPPSFLGDIPLRTYLGGTVLSVERYVSPRYRAPNLGTDQEEKITIGVASAEAPEFDVQEFYLSLSLACRANVNHKVHWRYIPPAEITAMDGGGAGTGWHRSDTYGSANEVSAQDLQVAKNVYEALQALDPAARRALNVPLTRWVASLDGKSLVDQAIDLGIALEALYVEERAAEIGFRLRIRAARHLREDPEERGTVIEQLRRFYELRSVAVHRGELGAKKQRIRDKPYEHGEVIEMARALCREGIFKVIDDGGLPNWERMALA